MSFDREEQSLLISPLDCPKSSEVLTDDKQNNITESFYEREGRATIQQSALNIAKTCMGTGTLALPYAASQGGLVFNIIGLSLISLWNLYSVDRLILCADLIKRMDQEEVGRVKVCPPPGTSTLGKVAWHSFGPVGLYFLDVMMIILLFGVITAYEDAAISFLQKTPFSTGILYLDAIGTVFLIAPLSCLQNVGFLSKYSAMGLSAIIFSFLIIFMFGITQNGVVTGWISITWDDLWPQSIKECSHWFGIVVFSYGVVPVAYNIQESMAEPKEMKHATTIALGLVFVIYGIISNGVFIIYAPSSKIEYEAYYPSSTVIKSHSFEGDVLQHLPKGILPTIIRLAMTGVIIVTAPLLVIPCSELLEGRLFQNIFLKPEKRISHQKARIALRITICIICTCISVFIPDFVSVVSFIGCFCVALVSFVLPPLFHVVLLWNSSIEKKTTSTALNHNNSHHPTIDSSSGNASSTVITTDLKSIDNSNASISPRSQQEDSQYQRYITTTTSSIDSCTSSSSTYNYYLLLDSSMIVLGIFATIITTYLTFKDLVHS